MSDPVRRLVQPSTASHRTPAPVTMLRCDECRVPVPFTDLRDRAYGRVCADCESDFLYWQQRIGGSPQA